MLFSSCSDSKTYQVEDQAGVKYEVRVVRESNLLSEEGPILEVARDGGVAGLVYAKEIDYVVAKEESIVYVNKTEDASGNSVRVIYNSHGGYRYRIPGEVVFRNNEGEVIFDRESGVLVSLPGGEVAREVDSVRVGKAGLTLFSRGASRKVGVSLESR